jgi:hypothetical protein
MSFLARLALLEPEETCPRLQAAAMERFWDGFDLATSKDERRLAAVYLLGYVVEVFLKVAFFRVRAWPADQPIDLDAVRTHAAWAGGNLHNLTGLADVLIAERGILNRPLDPVFAGELRRRVLVVASHWRENLRYRATPALGEELAEVCQSVDWLVANAEELWR